MSKIEVVLGDITQSPTETIVNANNSSLLAGGDRGVNAAIHKAAGDEVFQAAHRIRIQLGGCPVGEAIFTPAGDLPYRFILHAVGPVWKGGSNGEGELLAKTYRYCLTLANEKDMASIAFPNISTGLAGFPKDKAADIAIQTVSDFLANENKSLQKVVFYCHNQENYQLYTERLGLK